MWTKLEFENNSFRLGASHSALILGRHIIIHGGTGSDFGVHVDNSLTCLDLERSLCYQLPSNKKDNLANNLPIPTYGHSICYVEFGGESFLYKYGGALGNVYTSNIYRYNLRKLHWEQVKPNIYSNQVAARYRHDAFFWNEKMFIIGGSTSTHSFPLIPLPAFNLNSQSWEMINFSGVKPQPLRFHSSTQDKNSVYMLGGVAFEEQKRNRTVYCFDLNTYTCYKIARYDDPAYFHDIAFVPKQRKIYSFGGVIHIDPVIRTNHLHEFALNDQPLRLEDIAWRSMKNLLTISTNTLMDELSCLISKSPNLFGLEESSSIKNSLGLFSQQCSQKARKSSNYDKPLNEDTQQAKKPTSDKFPNFGKMAKFLVSPLCAIWARKMLAMIKNLRQHPEQFETSPNVSGSTESIYLDALAVPIQEESQPSELVTASTRYEQTAEESDPHNRRLSIFGRLMDLIVDTMSDDGSGHSEPSSNDEASASTTAQNEGNMLIFQDDEVESSTTSSEETSRDDFMSLTSSSQDDQQNLTSTGPRPRRGDPLHRRGVRGGPLRNQSNVPIVPEGTVRGSRRRRHMAVVVGNRGRRQQVREQANSERNAEASSSDFEYDYDDYPAESGINQREPGRNVRAVSFGLHYILNQLVGDGQEQRDPRDFLRNLRRRATRQRSVADAADGTTAPARRNKARVATQCVNSNEILPVPSESVEFLVVLLFLLGVPTRMIKQLPNGSKILSELTSVISSSSFLEGGFNTIFSKLRPVHTRLDVSIDVSLNQRAIANSRNRKSSLDTFAKKND
ncbi:hypothetical protein Ciccas_003840 [Cichlidogyrus casuarinus]|uniref:Uncharacterized protein n=1 Tax=Cichlidogyrus casuarinus TaxID=1844966 RepID=A0ABD2QDN5_9PLAT